MLFTLTLFYLDMQKGKGCLFVGRAACPFLERLSIAFIIDMN